MIDELNDFTSLLIEAAEIIVENQQASTSLIQSRLKLGYNRAGSIIDQLEELGILGQSKSNSARDVLIKNKKELKELLLSKIPNDSEENILFNKINQIKVDENIIFTENLNNDFDEIILKFKLLHQQEKYFEAINLFEDKIETYINDSNLYIAQKYVYALYKNDGTEKKALKEVLYYIDKFPQTDIFFHNAGLIYEYLGRYEHVDYFKDALHFYTLDNNKEKVKELKEKIELHKKNATHEFKVSDGITFCKYCGIKSEYAGSFCSDKTIPHNFILKNIDGKKTPICKKCGEKSEYARSQCI